MPYEGPQTSGKFQSAMVMFAGSSKFLVQRSGTDFSSALNSAIPSPKYFSKNAFSFSMTPCFFLDLPPPPKRETGGISLSISVPVVFNVPSRKALATNFLFSVQSQPTLSSHAGKTANRQKIPRHPLQCDADCQQNRSRNQGIE